MTHLTTPSTPTWLQPLVRGVPNLPGHPNPDRSKQSAVLILFSGDTLDESRVLLTHRSPTMRSHSGQVAFPGGRMDPGDADAVATALREAKEETGVRPETVQPLVTLDEVYIRATGYPVRPVVAHWTQPGGAYVASPTEVDEVFAFPVVDLINPANRFTVGMGDWRGPAFHANGYVVWGFTGGLLSSIIAHAGWEIPYDRDTVVDLRHALASSRNNER